MRRRRAGLTAQPSHSRRPAPQSGGSMQGNNSPVNKRTVRHRRKIGAAAWHAAAAARRSTRFAVFSAVVFRIARWRASGHGGQLTTPISDRSRARAAFPSLVRRTIRQIGARRFNSLGRLLPSLVRPNDLFGPLLPARSLADFQPDRSGRRFMDETRKDVAIVTGASSGIGAV
jgi:hypothetical protein